MYEDTDVCQGTDHWALMFEVHCDEAMLEDVEAEENYTFRAATILSSDLSECTKFVSFSHAAGCPAYSILGFTAYMAEHVWLSGTCLLVFGIMIAIFGRKWFAHVTGAFAGMCAFCTFMIFASIFQWLNTTTGLIICGLLGLCCWALVYWVMFKFNKVAVMFLCIGGGFLLGGIIEGLIIAISSWESFTFYLIVTIACMVIGGIFGWKHGEATKMWLTACVGSYIFMRGLTFFFGGFPSEMEMYNYMVIGDSSDLDFNGLFWMYVCIFVASLFLAVHIQKNWSYVKVEETPKTDANDANYKPAKAK